MQAFDELFRPFLTHYINSASMLQKFLTAVVIEEWARGHDTTHPTVLLEVSPLARDLSVQLLLWLQSDTPIAYHEMVFLLSRLHVDCYNLLHGFVTECRIAAACIPNLGTEIDPTGENSACFTIHTAREAVGTMFDELKNMLGRTKKKEVAGLVERRNAVAASIERFFDTKSEYDIRVSASFAAAYIALKATPEKVSPIVKGIMNGVKVWLNLPTLLVQILTVPKSERGEPGYPNPVSYCCLELRRVLCPVQFEPAS
jgi:TATA-binding protein-associated factor